MIVPSEIIQDDIVKLLVNEDDLEDEMFAVVGMNTGLTLGVKYLNPTLRWKTSSSPMTRLMDRLYHPRITSLSIKNGTNGSQLLQGREVLKKLLMLLKQWLNCMQIT
jgi:hypothetical protein